MIEVKNLSKKFGNFKAVNNINFSVNEGEIFGFLGPNGAGKTTTINMLTGLARPSSGEITIAGKDGVNNIKDVKQIIGVVPDESNLYDEMNGFENLTFCASLYGMKKKKRIQRANELLKLFSLYDTNNRPFKAYSKGMKRKLTIAAGIIHEPKILFLDEPTTGIDVESTIQIRKMIQTLNKKGTTIFLTTHYIEDASRLCHKIGFIVNGKVIKVDTIKNLINQAQNEHILEFISDSNISGIENELQNMFTDIKIEKPSSNSIRILSSEKLELMPFMRFFENKHIKIDEAKIVRPSLEDVFVKMTGIEADKLKKEKEK